MTIGILHDIQLDSGKSTPLYLQLAGKLELNICSGRAKANDVLPPERLLSQLLKISRFTTRRAIEVLCERGILTRRQGAGTYVNAGSPRLLTRLSGFTEEARQRGVMPGSLWLSREVVAASKIECRELDLPPHSLVARLVRLRTVDGAAVAIEQTTIPARHVPDVYAISGSLYEYLANRNAVPVRARQHIRAINANLEQARLTNIAPGDAMLHTVRVAYLENGTAVEMTQSYFRSDSHEYVTVI